MTTERESPKLTVSAVARRLGVAPATLRTWDRRYGLGPSEHTAGRHRRYGPADIARLELMQHALLRGASPGEAARYAHAADVTAEASREPESRASLRPVASENASAGSSAAVSGSPRGAGSGQDAVPDDEPILHSGVIEGDDEPGQWVSTVNTGGRGLRLAGAIPRARGLGRAVMALDSYSAQRILLEGFAQDGVVRTRREVVRPVLRALTEQRQRTGRGAEMLQLFNDSTLTALRAVIADGPLPRNPRPVLLVAAPGEAQELDLVTLAAALSAGAVGHRLFGPALPKEALDAAVRRAAPSAVVMWSEQPHYADPQAIGDIPNPRQRVRAFAAGPGWAERALPGHVELLDSWESAVGRIAESVLGSNALPINSDLNHSNVESVQPRLLAPPAGGERAEDGE